MVTPFPNNTKLVSVSGCIQLFLLSTDNASPNISTHLYSVFLNCKGHSWLLGVSTIKNPASLKRPTMSNVTGTTWNRLFCMWAIYAKKSLPCNFSDSRIQSPLFGVTNWRGTGRYKLAQLMTGCENYTTSAWFRPVRDPTCFIDVGNITQTIHVWYISLHLP